MPNTAKERSSYPNAFTGTDEDMVMLTGRTLDEWQHWLSLDMGPDDDEVTDGQQHD